MGPKSYSVYPWQAFAAYCYVTLSLLGPFISYEENKVLRIQPQQPTLDPSL